MAPNKPVRPAQLQLLIFLLCGEEERGRTSEILPTPKSGGDAALQHPFIPARSRAAARGGTRTCFATLGARQGGSQGLRNHFPLFLLHPDCGRERSNHPFCPSRPPSPGSIGAKRSCRARELPQLPLLPGPGRALLTHPIGIRRLHRLFIGPHRPQKALGLAFSPSLSPPRSAQEGEQKKCCQ